MQAHSRIDSRLWLVMLAVCVLVYLFGLGSAYAPTNGDEMVYIHIARMTAESGHWLPLQSELIGTRNTKPPLLIWQAMVAGGWGDYWHMWALRLPSIAYTFATTLLLAFFAHRITRDAPAKARNACLAAIVYLSFYSSFRYGRAYLTSAPETFWLALPMWWVLWLRVRHGTNALTGKPPLGWVACTLFGIAMGLGCAYKSFALVAPAGAAVWCAVLLSEPKLTWSTTVRTTLGLAWSTAIGIGIFALWFVLDPDPSAVWQEFVVAENAGKMSGGKGYWHAALYGAYPMWTQLLAYPANAGLLFFAVLGLAIAAIPHAFKRATYQQLTPAVWTLLVWLAVWLIVFTIPSQRSERYVIPAMPALAIVMALTWDKIPKLMFWITLGIMVPALVMLGRISWVMGHMQIASQPELALTLIAVCAGLMGAAAGFVYGAWTRNATLVVCMAVYASFGLMVAPLSKPAAGYSESTQHQLQGQRIAVPNGFTGQYERFQFVLPGARFTPYDAEGRNTGAFKPEMPAPERLSYLLDQFDAVVWIQESLDQAQPSCLPQCKLLGSRWHIKSRHKDGEVTLENLWQPQDWLFRREWLLSR